MLLIPYQAKISGEDKYKAPFKQIFSISKWFICVKISVQLEPLIVEHKQTK